MNIFFLDFNPTLCAEYHCDKHVVKMCLETAQILCSARHLLYDLEKPQYRLTHKNHPCVLWAAEASGNYGWLCHLGLQLCREYTYRYEKIHKCQDVIQACLSRTTHLGFPTKWPPFTQRPQCMPEIYRNNDIITAYRQYYTFDKLPSIQMRWTKREIPFWIKNFQN